MDFRFDDAQLARLRPAALSGKAVTAVRVLLARRHGAARCLCHRVRDVRGAPLDFSERQPLVAVERVAIDSVYRPAGAPPYVDHALPLTPEAATRALLEQRLQAVGGADRLQAGDPRCLG